MLYFTYFIFMFQWVSWKAILFFGGYLRIVGRSFWTFWEIVLDHARIPGRSLWFLGDHSEIPMMSFLDSFRVIPGIYERSFLKKKNEDMKWSVKRCSSNPYYFHFLLSFLSEYKAFEIDVLNLSRFVSVLFTIAVHLQGNGCLYII